MMMTGYEFKQFFHNKAEEARDNMDAELGALYDRMGEYADGNAKMLNTVNKMNPETMQSMLSDNLDFEQEFNSSAAVNKVNETIVNMFED